MLPFAIFLAGVGVFAAGVGVGLRIALRAVAARPAPPVTWAPPVADRTAA